MSKYVVLYNESYTKKEQDAPNPYSIQRWQDREYSQLSMQKFDDEQAAIDFAKKNYGVILIPATINSKIVPPKEKS